MPKQDTPWEESLSRLIQGHDTGTAESKIMLKSGFRTFNLSLAGVTAELTDKFITLGKTGRAEWVPLGEQPAGRVCYNLAAIGIVRVPYKLLCATF